VGHGPGCEDAEIIFCPLHANAQALRDALEKIATEYVDINVCSLCGNQWKAIPEMVAIAKTALKRGE
jgi:uncharacterized SAM-dependent methyltransferase